MLWFQLAMLHRWLPWPVLSGRSSAVRRLPGSAAFMHAGAGKSLPAFELPQQAPATAAKSSSLCLAASLPLKGLGMGGELSLSWAELFQQWQLLPAAILPRGHLPVTSQTCNPHVMGEQPSSHQERLGPGGSCGCCQNNSSDTQPAPCALQSCTQGRRLLGTRYGPDKWSCLPRKLALHRMSTCFLQHALIVFPHCSVSLLIRLLFVRFPCVHI